MDEMPTRKQVKQVRVDLFDKIEIFTDNNAKFEEEFKK